ncbi:lipoprotein [Gallaecimonas xiamenensis]|uniref:Lipoprotein n=1 Tax=Gallaecimonas xiamenensis 3-C-1 TaxID=745411 RepID=K2JK64_9GAMM|nr:hypothetical protein [Gallaecimonas xiamenensis]EKE75663.1 hypothetical protein B3C1_06273 [Gallaecimonas xiamenensis 3-C-1]
MKLLKLSVIASIATLTLAACGPKPFPEGKITSVTKQPYVLVAFEDPTDGGNYTLRNEEGFEFTVDFDRKCMFAEKNMKIGKTYRINTETHEFIDDQGRDAQYYKVEADDVFMNFCIF